MTLLLTLRVKPSAYCALTSKIVVTTEINVLNFSVAFLTALLGKTSTVKPGIKH